MIYHPPPSSKLARLGYDPATKEMRIKVVGAGLYRFNNVDAHHIAHLLYGPEPMAYFNREIKPNHTWEQLPEERRSLHGRTVSARV